MTESTNKFSEDVLDLLKRQIASYRDMDPVEMEKPPGWVTGGIRAGELPLIITSDTFKITGNTPKPPKPPKPMFTTYPFPCPLPPLTPELTMTTQTTTVPTDILLLIDRSGSMTKIKQNMEEMLNTFLEGQRAVEGECLVSLIEFDTLKINGGLELHTVFADCPLQKIAPNSITLTPRGNTPLHDAVGTVLSQRLFLADPERKQIVIIITDGWENASDVWNPSSLKRLMAEVQKNKNFAITYLGSNQDAILVAGEMGIAAAGAAGYAGTEGAMGAMGMSLSSNVTSMRAMKSSAFSYTTAERQTMGGE